MKFTPAVDNDRSNPDMRRHQNNKSHKYVICLEEGASIGHIKEVRRSPECSLEDSFLNTDKLQMISINITHYFSPNSLHIEKFLNTKVSYKKNLIKGKSKKLKMTLGVDAF